MNYEIKGNVVPAVEVSLSRGESVFTQSGGMFYQTEGIKMDTNTRGGLFKGIGRMFAGESMFMATYTATQDAKVAFAHGQMKEKELEEIMMGFMNHEIDVLVSTTIIETGLDIPNVNTMIIHDANQLGLSQLYQIRGRVGRSDRIAYAYLMYKREKILTSVAIKRLEAIKEFTELGSGYKISMRDLSIRGAGDIATGIALRLYRAKGYREVARRPVVKDDWRVAASEWILFTKPARSA